MREMKYIWNISEIIMYWAVTLGVVNFQSPELF